jgi:hypothetical protein
VHRGTFVHHVAGAGLEVAKLAPEYGKDPYRNSMIAGSIAAKLQVQRKSLVAAMFGI